MTRFDTDPNGLRVGASASGPGSRASDGAQEVSTLTGFDPSRGEVLSQVMEALTRDQEARWSHLIEFAESQREAGGANNAPASNHGN